MTSDQKSLSAWQAEEERQAQILAQAISAAIHETAKQFDAPIMNAVAGALVSAQASMLSAVADPHNRKELRKAMERSLPKALAEAITRGNGTCQVVVLGGVRQ